MWPWLRSERFKKIVLLTQRQQFLGQLCLLTCIAHVFVVIISVFLSGRSREHERFIISAKNCNTVYVLSPLKKQIKSTSKNFSNRSSKASKVINYDTYQALKKQKSKTLLPVAKKSEKSIQPAPVKVKKQSKSLQSSLLALKKDKQPAAPKAQLTISGVKVVEKKTVEPKKVVEQELIKKVEIKKEEVAPCQPKETSIEVVEKKLTEKQNIESKETMVQEELSQALAPQENLDVDNVTFIGYEQLDSLGVQNNIQQRVLQHFKSPVGIKKDVSCEISVLVGDSGKAKKVTVVRSSGILMYDVSARGAMYKIEFPQEVWNKTITIVLGQ